MPMSKHGPLFDGRAAAAAAAFCKAAERRVAQRGVTLVKTRLDSVLKHPTGRYRSNIQVDNSTPTKVTDGNIVYGNWLEGTGSRNRTTRFKGYRTFRQTTELLQREAVRVADEILPAYVGRM